MILRRIQAVIVTATLWALVWLPPGIALDLFAHSPPSQHRPPPAFGVLSAVWIAWGAVSGAVFAILLAVAERRNTIVHLSLWRVSAWGAVACAILPALLAIWDYALGPGVYTSFDWLLAGVVIAVCGFVGAVCAASTIALGRRAPARGGSLTSG